MGVVGLAGPAAAQSLSELVDQLDARGYAVAPGVDVDVNRLEQAARQLVADDVVVAALDEPWAGGNYLLAVDLVERLVEERTVLVDSPVGDGSGDVELGAASAITDGAAIDDALDDAFAAPDDDPIAIALAFAAGLDPSVGDSAGSTLGTLALFGVIALVIAVAWWLSSRRQRARRDDRVAAARTELQDDLASVANDILALGDRAELADDPEASEHFATANEQYLRVDAGVASAQTFDQIDDLDDELELAAWHLDVVEARLDGEEPPPEPDTRDAWEHGDGPAAASLPGGAPAASEPRAARPPVARTSGGLGGLGGLGGFGLGRRRRRPMSMGGGMGGLLGGIVGGMIAGGGRRRYGGGFGGGYGRGGGGLRPAPRRTRRRSAPSRRRPSAARRSSSVRRSSRGRGRRRG